jgi:hypothetical protein
MLLALTFAALTARADTVEVWSYDSFPDDEWIGGTDGWENGYDEDQWYGYTGSTGTRWAFAYSDDNTGDAGGDWGEGGALDNFLVNAAEDVGDGLFTTTFYTGDDDSFGAVIGQQNAGKYYLFLFCGEAGNDETSCPIELDTRSGSGAAIVLVNRGEARVLAETDAGYDLGREGQITGDL